MKRFIAIIALAAAFSSCAREKWPAQPDWSLIPDPDEAVDDGLMKPAPCSNKVVAHRGGSSEAGVPDNSIAALQYAMSIGAYGSECDVYYTSDDNVIVAHADGDFKVNGLLPYEHTVAEIRAAGVLSNGEQIPTLEDYINTVMVEGNCTKLVVDVKKLDSAHLEYVAMAARKSCEIIDRLGALHFVELLCTGTNENTMKIAWGYARELGVPIGMNSGKSPSQYNLLGFEWANLSASGNMNAAAGGSGTCDLNAYLEAGVQVSVYNIDKQKGDGNAVYTEDAWNYYIKNAAKFRTLCSNYPKWLIEKLGDASKAYDGIGSQSDFEAFSAALITDPTAERFQNEAGVVVLKTDLNIGSAAQLSQFSGVLDGGGHTITMNVSSDNAQLGLFKSLRGTIRNLNISGRIESTAVEETEIHIGAFAARAYGAVLENCCNKAEIVVSSPGSKNHCDVIGGLIGKIWEGCRFVKCSNEGKIIFESDAYCVTGGLAGGSNADEGKIIFDSCSCSGEMVCNGGNESDWHYLGGFIGKPQSSLLLGNSYGLEVLSGTCSSKITIGGKAKVRAGGISAYAKAANHFKDCVFNGTFEIGAAALERNVGGICGFQETSCQALVEQCTLDGSLNCAPGATKAYWIGGIISTGYNAASVVDGCKTTSRSTVANSMLGSIGMIAARPNTAITVKNCRVAGTVEKEGERTVISASNLEDWMFTGFATTANVITSANTFNNE